MNVDEMLEALTQMEEFLVTAKKCIHDRDLSADAKGVLFTILLGDGGDHTAMDLTEYFPHGVKKIRNARRELVDRGYLSSVRSRDEDGHFSYSYRVCTDTGETQRGLADVTEGKTPLSPNGIPGGTCNEEEPSRSRGTARGIRTDPLPQKGYAQRPVVPKRPAAGPSEGMRYGADTDRAKAPPDGLRIQDLNEPGKGCDDDNDKDKELRYIFSFYPSVGSCLGSGGKDKDIQGCRQRSSEREMIRDRIKKQYGYKALYDEYADDRELVDSVFNILTDTFMTGDEKGITISGTHYSYADIKGHLELLKAGHIRRIVRGISRSRTKVERPVRYVLKCIMQEDERIIPEPFMSRTRAAPVNRFNAFEQHEYDFDELEKMLVEN